MLTGSGSKRATTWLRMATLALGVLSGALAAAPAEAARDYTAFVIDATNGNVLYQRGPDKPMYPASLTKMMTLYLVFEALEAGTLSPDTRMRVSQRAQDQQPAELGLVKGQSITVEDAIMALITKSANDAATVVAEKLGGGSEWRFAVKMTRKARELGMRNTTFMNASGWHDSKMKSTARDMSIMSLRLLSDFPRDYRRFSTRTFSYRGTTYRNHNRLLGAVDGVDGIKTGYTRRAGWNLAASARVDGRRIVGVIMGGRSADWRNRRMTQLIGQGFKTAAREDRAVPLPQYHPARGAPATLYAHIPLPRNKPRSGLSDLLDRALRGAAAGETGVDQGSADDAAWGVQLGAYAVPGNAWRVRERAESGLAPVLDGVALAVVTAAADDGTILHRVRIVDLTEDQARLGCRVLDEIGIPCSIVRIRN